MQAPNGWFSHDLIIWNDLDQRGFVTKGFELEMPDLRHASEAALDSFYESVRQFLHSLDESTRAQIRWSVDSDYREELMAYKAVTDTRCAPDSWAAITRNERFNRAWKAMMRSRGIKPFSDLSTRISEQIGETRRMWKVSASCNWQLPPWIGCEANR